MYRRNRYLDPETGQFTQTDPIGIAGGLNLYGYAGGDPVNLSDPFGLCPTCLLGALVGMGIEAGAQMWFEGELDGGRIALAGAAGFLSGGASTALRVGTGVRAAVVGTISVLEGEAKAGLEGRETSFGEAGRNFGIGWVASGVGEAVTRSAILDYANDNLGNLAISYTSRLEMLEMGEGLWERLSTRGAIAGGLVGGAGHGPSDDGGG